MKLKDHAFFTFLFILCLCFIGIVICVIKAHIDAGCFQKNDPEIREKTEAHWDARHWNLDALDMT
jgi:hypothetical protein